MSTRTEYHPRRGVGGWLLVVALSGVFFAVSGPFPLEDPGIGDIPFFALIALFFVSGTALLLGGTGFSSKRFLRFLFLPELLLTYGLLLASFSYIFALNANMDYVQRFVSSGGNLRLALDTETERQIVLFRFSPFLVVAFALYLYGRVRSPLASGYLPGSIARLYGYPIVGLPPVGPQRENPAIRRLRRWALLFVFASVLLSTAALPSFLVLDGLPFLAWIALVPLLVALAVSRPRMALFYGVVYGVFRTMLVNYWLGTFSLVSLQFTVIIFTIHNLIFFSVLVFCYRRIRIGRVLLIAALWTLYEYLHSIGFLGYPWGLQAHAVYSLVPVIQVSEYSGVWGVSFLVVLVNAALAHLLLHRLVGRRQGLTMPSLTALVVLATVLYGVAILAQEPGPGRGITTEGSAESTAAQSSPAGAATPSTVRLALIQQNSDPRKHDYNRTLGSLIRLTDRAMESDPDIVVWSETAFVPNIRRWSQEAPPRSRFARLVDRFLAYQRSLGTWLLTGNDDYEVVFDDSGDEVDRLNHNAAVLFTPSGFRYDTYRKIKLVPFTEHFPFEEELPWVYELLEDFDVTFWEAGNQRTVFHHPDFSFSTPICYEDAFPDEVRRFVLAGADVILNISNDYWSLKEVAAQQHFVAGLFRSVENRRPVARATASGVTGHVDRYGRIVATGGFYREDFVIADVELPPDDRTFYTTWGDWFPLASAGLCLVLLLLEIPRRRGEKRGLPPIDLARLDFLREMAQRRRAYLRQKKRNKTPGV